MLFVPVWDMNPLKSVRFQYVTATIIALSVIIFVVFETGLIGNNPDDVVRAFGLVPSSFKTLKDFIKTSPDHLRFISYIFLHGSALHLIGNMVFLFVFGDNVEDAMGHIRFILFYLMCGIFAGVAHCLFTSAANTPLIGASGAISGVIAAYLMLHPNIRVWVLVPVPVLPFLPLRFSAGFVLGVWILYQLFNAVFSDATPTAWDAHIGGFLAGAALILFMRRPGVRLFDRATGVEAST